MHFYKLNITNYIFTLYSHLIINCKRISLYMFNNILYLLKGWEIQIEEQSSFLKCQVCTMNNCSFKGCSESLFGAIFCKNKPYTSQSQNTTTLSSLHQNVSATIVMPNHSTTNQPLVSESKTGNYDKDQSTSTIYTQQTSSNFILPCKRNNCCRILSSLLFKF